MNPIIVILGFVVLLGVLIYYLQSREEKFGIMPLSEEETEEDKTVIKAKDYQAHYEKELKEKPEERRVEEDELVNEDVEEEVETTESYTIEENLEDIIEIDGIGPKFKKLLIVIGYDSRKKISEASPEDLYEKLIKANEDKEITKRPPTLREVEQWVDEAKSR
jgi:predicted flap endonuclease-1-like 5' DNA nuclease